MSWKLKKTSLLCSPIFPFRDGLTLLSWRCKIFTSAKKVRKPCELIILKFLTLEEKSQFLISKKLTTLRWMTCFPRPPKQTAFSSPRKRWRSSWWTRSERGMMLNLKKRESPRALSRGREGIEGSTGEMSRLWEMPKLWEIPKLWELPTWAGQEKKWLGPQKRKKVKVKIKGNLVGNRRINLWTNPPFKRSREAPLTEETRTRFLMGRKPERSLPKL